MRRPSNESIAAGLQPSQRRAAAGYAESELCANTIYAGLFHDVTAVCRGERKVGE